MLLDLWGNAFHWDWRDADLSVDESISPKLYALAFDTDKTAQLTHLKSARRCFKKAIRDLQEEQTKNDAQQVYESHPLLKLGKQKLNRKNLDTIQIKTFFRSRGAMRLLLALSGRKTFAGMGKGR